MTSLPPNRESAILKPRAAFSQAEDIRGWSDAKLRAAINEMYARHSADFKDKRSRKRSCVTIGTIPRPGLSYDAAEAEFSDSEKQNVKLLGDARKHAKLELSASTDSPPPRSPNGSGTGALPKSAVVVPTPEDRDSLLGNIKVVFTDAHSEMWTKGGNCGTPHVSRKGDIGWSRQDKLLNDR